MSQLSFMSAPFDPFGNQPPPGIPWGVNFGGGDNSRALLLALHDRGLRPDFVVFSDTGSEWPETYESLPLVEEWCRRVGFPFAVTRWERVKGDMAGQFESVHENALRTGYLPSKAYGLSGCTFKWKIQPLQRWRRARGFVPAGIAIGYDVGEKARLIKARKRACNDTETATDEVMWYPLVGFGMDRPACVARIEDEGWTSHKSACFVCPNTRPHEWEALREKHPELHQIAVRIEEGAKAAGNATTKSLFRSYDPNAHCVCTADGCLISEAAVTRT
jgi:hypothetical protein